jgi:hypothetical protein
VRGIGGNRPLVQTLRRCLPRGKRGKSGGAKCVKKRVGEVWGVRMSEVCVPLSQGRVRCVFVKGARVVERSVCGEGERGV